MDGQLRKVMTVVKMRGSEHSKDLRAYEITSEGLVVGASYREYRGLITGVPKLKELARRLVYPGLTDLETAILQELAEIAEASEAEVARQTGLDQPALTAAMDRLVALNYVFRSSRDGKTLYRAAARPLES